MAEKSSFFKDFKAFISKGNIVDMATGVIIGGAFSKIVTSLVNDIISPIIGLLVKVDFSELVLNIVGVDIKYGAFIMAVINFLIIALVVFTIVRSFNKIKAQAEEKAREKDAEAIAKAEAEKKAAEEAAKKAEAEKKAAEEKRIETELELLKEIRDLLKK